MVGDALETSTLGNTEMKIVTGVKYRSAAMNDGWDPYVMIGPVKDTATAGSPSISSEFYSFASTGSVYWRIDSLAKNTLNKKVIGIGQPRNAADVLQASSEGSMLIYIHFQQTKPDMD